RPLVEHERPDVRGKAPAKQAGHGDARGVLRAKRGRLHPSQLRRGRWAASGRVEPAGGLHGWGHRLRPSWGRDRRLTPGQMTIGRMIIRVCRRKHRRIKVLRHATDAEDHFRAVIIRVGPPGWSHGSLTFSIRKSHLPNRFFTRSP